ncbi:hypothetical protein [Candidatus Thiosymbion oneisti]|uniref:hypothetical protein n=1 Tax=Candidatus Thiosymbion oneisti TaxID=589554 RepID=UPI000B7F47D6|nr:hypothetical protein [Candidatus Thiosymbion oneisti]
MNDRFKMLIAVGLLAVGIGGTLAPAELRAQTANTEPTAALGQASLPSPTQTTEPPTDGTPPADAKDEPADLRTTYNQALTDLNAGELEAAARGFEAVRAGARTGAGTDGEARFRATYNLGWVEVKRANAALDQEPRAALQALQRAADWFREASALRPEHAASRLNLELVLRRALVLADHLAQHGEEDLAARLEQLIEGQRTFLTELGRGIDLADLQDDPNAAEQARRTLRTFATGQLELLTQAERLSETAGQEQAGLQAKPDEERSTQEAVRRAQLEQLLSHLHRARERMGQARGQLRRLAAKRAYRRVAAALGDLKRARDQLLGPVARLDALITDGLELMRQTGHKVALDTQPGQPAPAWLTVDYLGETQTVLEARTGELHSGLNAGLAQAKETPVVGPFADQAEDFADSPEQQAQLRRRLEAATPLIGAARADFQRALADLEAERPGKALELQRGGVAKLVAAREHFLELKRLVELLYQDQQRIAALIAPGEAVAASDSGPGEEVATPDDPAADRSEYLPVARELQAGNRERLRRVSAAILDQLGTALDAEEQARSAQAGDPQATTAPQAPDPAVPTPPAPADLETERRYLEQADALRVEAEKAMQQALEDLIATEATAEKLPTGDPELASAMDRVRQSVDLTLSRVADLRRLFFSVIDHLRETLRRQIDLGDRTEETAVLAATEPAEEITRRFGPIAPEQRALAETAGSIAEALEQQAEQPLPPPPETQEDPPQGNLQEQAAHQAQEQQARLGQAADQVTSARDHMDQAAEAIAAEPPTFEAIRDHQRQAVEALAAALAALQPPPQEQPDQSQADQQDQQQQGSQPADQDQQGTEPQPAPGDAGQLLQGIRDREAQRREQRARQRHRGYEPVEKDW